MLGKVYKGECIENNIKMTKKKTLKEICWENKIGLREFDILKKEAIKFLKDKYHPDKTTIELKDLFDFFNITEEDLKASHKQDH